MVIALVDGAAIVATASRGLAPLVPAGGWERVTLDSASDSALSTPLIDRLGFAGLVEWVNDAHATGRETYISGGMSAEHIELATYAGVDGIGIGNWITAAT